MTFGKPCSEICILFTIKMIGIKLIKYTCKYTWLCTLRKLLLLAIAKLPLKPV